MLIVPLGKNGIVAVTATGALNRRPLPDAERKFIIYESASDDVDGSPSRCMICG
jgi:hypothetical protein